MIEPSDGDTDAGGDVRRIEDDVEVEGVLRIADHTVCEGDLIAPAGIILGASVHVKGDVYTDGTVEMGPGARVDGEIIPYENGHELDPTADISAAEEAVRVEQVADGQASPAREAPDHLGTTALASTLDVLLALSLDHSGHSRPLGLRSDALEDVLEGVHRLIEDLHLDGDSQRPWPREQIVGVLVQQVLPLVLPVTLEGRDDRALKLTIGRPSPGPHRTEIPADWPDGVTAFLKSVAGMVHEGAHVDLISPKGAPRSPQGPSIIGVLLRLEPP